eukprot:CAMPEP_0182575994 /NCGR_PEP_ID=MMETSP1324-20130603/32216_1 /TAXON_ID=236786 /ORGANISM="Florenciella sp., Strain RCC1587" /LENGTH=69 /DNA_ID=CAMNT_0024791635 /DNA_START=13 /DNA_END=218 /DNA_ORIENTATION=+
MAARQYGLARSAGPHVQDSGGASYLGREVSRHGWPVRMAAGQRGSVLLAAVGYGSHGHQCYEWTEAERA